MNCFACSLRQEKAVRDGSTSGSQTGPDSPHRGWAILLPAFVAQAPAFLLLDLKFGIEHTIQQLTESKFTTNPWSSARAPQLRGPG
jgi:hypothetical protein